MMKKKKSNKAQIKELIRKSWDEIVDIVPLIRIYLIHWNEEKENQHGGHFTIWYSSENFQAVLTIFAGVYDHPCDKTHIEWSLCHEAGHIYLWEHEGKFTDTEKAATLIGELIYKLLMNKRENAKKKRLQKRI